MTHFIIFIVYKCNHWIILVQPICTNDSHTSSVSRNNFTIRVVQILL